MSKLLTSNAAVSEYTLSAELVTWPSGRGVVSFEPAVKQGAQYDCIVSKQGSRTHRETYEDGEHWPEDKEFAMNTREVPCGFLTIDNLAAPLTVHPAPA